ncbi:MAG: hypothetical protein ABH828_04630 [archaeon]
MKFKLFISMFFLMILNAFMTLAVTWDDDQDEIIGLLIILFLLWLLFRWWHNRDRDKREEHVIEVPGKEKVKVIREPQTPQDPQEPGPVLYIENMPVIFEKDEEIKNFNIYNRGGPGLSWEIQPTSFGKKHYAFNPPRGQESHEVRILLERKGLPEKKPIVHDEFIVDAGSAGAMKVPVIIYTGFKEDGPIEDDERIFIGFIRDLRSNTLQLNAFNGHIKRIATSLGDKKETKNLVKKIKKLNNLIYIDIKEYTQLFELSNQIEKHIGNPEKQEPFMKEAFRICEIIKKQLLIVREDYINIFNELEKDFEVHKINDSKKKIMKLGEMRNLVLENIDRCKVILGEMEITDVNAEKLVKSAMKHI